MLMLGPRWVDRGDHRDALRGGGVQGIPRDAVAEVEAEILERAKLAAGWEI